MFFMVEFGIGFMYKNLLAQIYNACIALAQADSKESRDTLSRGKQSIAINLKKEEGVAVVKKLCHNADVLIEPFRRGVH